MALPPLEGDIVLRDNASDVFNRIASSADRFTSQLNAADQRVAAFQSSLNSLGGAQPLAQPRQAIRVDTDQQAAQARQAIAEQEAQRRIVLASTSIGRLSNIEEKLTAATAVEAKRREALTSAETQKRRTLLQSSLKGLSTREIDSLIGRLHDLGTQADQARQRIAQIDKATQGAGGAQRVSATRNEVRERQQLVQRLSDIQAQEEREITQAVQTESRRRVQTAQQEQAQRQRQAQGGLLGGGALGGLAATAGTFLTVQFARQLENTLRGFATANTEIKRANVAFNELAGGVSNAQGRLVAIQQGMAGTVSQLQAIKIANQAAALGLAQTGEEFGRLAQAARIVTLISPVIDDAGQALTELGLASANLSFRRLDQLGLSVTEVRNRMKDLQSANDDLSDSQAFLEASVDALITKGGRLTDSTAAQASGVERLTVAINEFLDQEGKFSNGADRLYGDIADVVNQVFTLLNIGSDKNVGDNINARLAQFKQSLEEIKEAEKAAVSKDRLTLDDVLFGGGLQSAVTNYTAEGEDGLNRMRQAAQQSLRAFTILDTAYQNANQDLVDGKDFAINYRAELRGIAVDAERGAIAHKDIEAAVADATRKYKELQDAQRGAGTADALLAQKQRIVEGTTAAEILAQRYQDIATAQAQLEQFKGTGLADVGDTLTKQLVALQESLAQTGDLPEGSARQFSFLKAAAESAGIGVNFLTDANERLGKTFVTTNPEIQNLAKFVLLLNAEFADTGNLLQYKEGLALVDEQFNRIASRRAESFDLGFEGATNGIALINAATSAGIQGLDQYAEAYAKIRSEITASGGATGDQLRQIQLINKEVEAAAFVQNKYADSLGTLDSGFIGSSEAAQALIREMARIIALANTGSITFADASVALSQLDSELRNLATTEPAQAIEDFVSATERAVSSSGQLVDGVNGLPVAFDAADLAGRNLSATLQQLIADAQGLGAAAANSGFNLAQRLVPSLGVGGAIQQGLQFQQQSDQLTNAFLEANSARVQGGQAPLDTRVLETGLAALNQFQSAFVQDATRAAEGIGGAVSGIGDQINNALDGLISGILKPTTGGLIPDSVLKDLLPREDALDENARRLADVAVKGFKSPWYDGLRDLQLIPDDVAAQGEEAIRRFAAEGVRKHTEGLTTEFYNVDAAVAQVIEKLRGNQAQAQFLDQVRAQVKAVAGDVDDLDLQEALGIDVSAQRGARAAKSALAGLPTPEEIMAQMQALFSGESGNPIVSALSISTDQQGELNTSTQTAIQSAGEAMVTQATQGAYGQRSIDAILAGIEVKKSELEKSGRNAAEWMGGALLDEFSQTVPSGLLDILIVQLVPLLQESQARNSERTGGTAAQ